MGLRGNSFLISASLSTLPTVVSSYENEFRNRPRGNAGREGRMDLLAGLAAEMRKLHEMGVCFCEANGRHAFVEGTEGGWSFVWIDYDRTFFRKRTPYARRITDFRHLNGQRSRHRQRHEHDAISVFLHGGKLDKGSGQEVDARYPPVATAFPAANARGAAEGAHTTLISGGSIKPPRFSRSRQLPVGSTQPPPTQNWPAEPSPTACCPAVAVTDRPAHSSRTCLSVPST